MIKQLPIATYGWSAIIIGIVFFIVSFVSFNPGSTFQPPLGDKIVGLIVSGLIIIGGIAALYGFPSYNFCWGDNIKSLARRQAVGKYIIGGVIVSLVLGVMGSIIATLFFLK